MTKREFIEELRECPTEGGCDSYYEKIKDLTEEYMADSGDYSPEDCFNDFIDEDTADLLVRERAVNGLVSLHNFICGIDFYGADYFYVNGYGNLENISGGNLDCLVEDIISCVGEDYEDEEDEEDEDEENEDDEE